MTDLSTAPETSVPEWPHDTTGPAPEGDRESAASPYPDGAGEPDPADLSILAEPASIVLARFEAAGWRNLHNRLAPGPEGLFIDHVAIGAAGVFVVDSSSFEITDKGPVTPSADVLARVQRTADAVRSVLPPLTRQYVVPVLTYPDKTAMSIARGAVQVCTTSMLTRVIESRHQVLSSGEINDVVTNLDSALVAADPNNRPAVVPPTPPTEGQAPASAMQAEPKRGRRRLGRRSVATGDAPVTAPVAEPTPPPRASTVAPPRPWVEPDSDTSATPATSTLPEPVTETSIDDVEPHADEPVDVTPEPELVAEPEAIPEPELVAEPEAIPEPELVAEPEAHADVIVEADELSAPDVLPEPEAVAEPTGWHYEAPRRPEGTDDEPWAYEPPAESEGVVDTERFEHDRSEGVTAARVDGAAAADEPLPTAELGISVDTEVDTWLDTDPDAEPSAHEDGTLTDYFRDLRVTDREQPGDAVAESTADAAPELVAAPMLPTAYEPVAEPEPEPVAEPVAPAVDDEPSWDELSLDDVTGRASTTGPDGGSAVAAVAAAASDVTTEPAPVQTPRQPGGRRKAPTKSWQKLIPTRSATPKPRRSVAAAAALVASDTVESPDLADSVAADAIDATVAEYAPVLEAPQVVVPSDEPSVDAVVGETPPAAEPVVEAWVESGPEHAAEPETTDDPFAAWSAQLAEPVSPVAPIGPRKWAAVSTDDELEASIATPVRVDLSPLYLDRAAETTPDHRGSTRAERRADPERSAALTSVAARWKALRVAAEPVRPAPEPKSTPSRDRPSLVGTKTAKQAVKQSTKESGKQSAKQSATQPAKQAVIQPGASGAPGGLSSRGRATYAAMNNGADPLKTTSTDESDEPRKTGRVRKVVTWAIVIGVLAFGAMHFSTIKTFVTDHVPAIGQSDTGDHKGGRNADDKGANGTDKPSSDGGAQGATHQ